jgi:ribosomal protein S18 acetylase RimI-like enzyme
MSHIQYDRARDDADLQQILQLQQANLPASLTLEERQSQGYVTVTHDLDLLRKMNAASPHIIARSANQVIAYALAMEVKFRNDIDILIPMFDRIDTNLKRQGKAQNYIVMGQICIAKQFRGQGIFGGLYTHMQASLADRYDYCITEVDAENLRSLKAHHNQGFQRLELYPDDTGRMWELIIWDWK